ncbi:DUF1800 domain-containing protein [Burkholderia glumae]|uniref:DUF1800 domain-containing protein n=1 Tax=Burkholderia glumae TaxID=337 RepID=UPI0035303AE3|nr:DUF1800 domain-containing protein [Burkholderia glumae]
MHRSGTVGDPAGARRPAAMLAPLDADDARFLLERTGFSPTPAEWAPYVGMTRAAAVDALLAGARRAPAMPLPDWADVPLPPRAVRNAWTPDQRRDDQRLQAQRYDALRAWWLGEMLTTPSPLAERMTLFWHRHFTSGQDKVPYPRTMAAQHRLLRAQALGNFGTMLHAVAIDPAMLQYLDGASNRKGRPNENFAREVMELFTLGEGHYTQHDVTDAARALTGWGLDADTLETVWHPNLHDDGIKTVLGQTGPLDTRGLLDVLLAQPGTARFVAAKLWREFVSDTPEPAELDTVAARFRESGYEIGAALAALFSTDAFWSDAVRGVHVKAPTEFVVGTVRMFGLDYGDAAQFVPVLNALGERLFAPPNVKGWPGGALWINSSTLLARKQFVERMFRSTASGYHAKPPMAGMMRAAGGKAAMPGAGPLANGAMRFDLDGWLARFGATPQARPTLSTELQLQHAVLPISPVAAIDADANGAAYLRALLMDPVYQLS